jgi:hypothetical protein
MRETRVIRLMIRASSAGRGSAAAGVVAMAWLRPGRWQRDGAQLRLARDARTPETLIATAIATAAFPTLSEFAARGQIPQCAAHCARRCW